MLCSSVNDAYANVAITVLEDYKIYKFIIIIYNQMILHVSGGFTIYKD